jgi:predicted short-subunit dehydrogenase-like oxidoreductase (DUF2520 family)
MNLQSLSFAGAGRVGSALCRELFHAGYRIDLVASESENSDRSLADSCEALWSSNLIFPSTTEIIIVAVPDVSLKNVLNDIRCSPDALVAHTAGSFGLDVFPARIIRKGIFYPLQTFSRGRDVSFKELPFLLEASDDRSSLILKSLVDSIGGKVHFVDTEHRRILHLAAVFICNFTNHMLTLGKDIAGKTGFSFEILKPLLNETILKAMTIGPENSQTGPAVRNDRITIKKQLDLLSFSPELQQIYNEITESIIKYYKKS